MQVRVALGSLFSSSADKTIKRYDLATHAVTLSWEAHAHSITCLAASEQLGLVASGADLLVALALAAVLTWQPARAWRAAKAFGEEAKRKSLAA